MARQANRFSAATRTNNHFPVRPSHARSIAGQTRYRSIHRRLNSSSVPLPVDANAKAAYSSQLGHRTLPHLLVRKLSLTIDRPARRLRRSYTLHPCGDADADG